MPGEKPARTHKRGKPPQGPQPPYAGDAAATSGIPVTPIAPDGTPQERALSALERLEDRVEQMQRNQLRMEGKAKLRHAEVLQQATVASTAASHANDAAAQCLKFQLDSSKALHRRDDAADQRFVAANQRFETADQRFAEVDKRFPEVDKRFAAVDKHFDEAIQHFAILDDRVGKLTKRLERVEAQLQASLVKDRFARLIAAKNDDPALWKAAVAGKGEPEGLIVHPKDLAWLTDEKVNSILRAIDRGDSPTLTETRTALCLALYRATGG